MGILEGLWPSLIVAIGALITISIITLLVTYFLYIPVRRYTLERKKFIEDDLDEANKRVNESKILFKEAQAEVLSATDKSQSIIETGVAEGKAIAIKITEDANFNASALLAKSERNAIEEKKKLLSQAKNEVANIAIMAAEKIIKKELDQKSNQDLIKSFIKDLDK